MINFTVTYPMAKYQHYILSLLFLTLLSTPLKAQVIQYGLKTGLQYSWVRMDDPSQQKLVVNKPIVGFNVGVVVTFKVKTRYFLHTELLYSTKGKKVEGIVDPTLEDKVIYQFIDFPMLYNIQFKRNLAADNLKQFKWYIGAGPIFSYWLGGKGTINNSEFVENKLPPQNYTLKFGVRGEDKNELSAVYVDKANRLQVGFNFGGGILLEPVNGRKIMVDLRFEFGQSWLGKANSTDYALPLSYHDNLQSSNMGFRFSMAYLFEANLDKKVRNKGKSRSKLKRG